MKKHCANCKHYFYDYSTGASECGKYDDMTEDETEKYYMDGEENCPYWEEDNN